MATEHIPVFRGVSVGVGGTTIDFTGVRVMGSIYVINKSTDAVYMTLTNVVPPASLGNDRKQLLENEALNLDNIEYTFVSLITAAGASNVEVVAVQRSGAVGGGEL